MADGDLERPDLDELDWSTAARAGSLSTVFRHAIALAASTEQWYASRRRWKRFGGRVLRVGAILLGAVAAVLPILSQIDTSDDAPALAPGWATVALTAAAALVAFDRYFGFSSGWMRFMAAELRVTRLRHEFEYDWQALRAAAADPPSDDELAAHLARARTFVLAVDDVVADETGSWIADFRTSLERVEQTLGRADNP